MGEGKSCVVCNVFGVLVAIGALNWGLVGLFDFNIVTALLGEGTGLTKIAYIIIGLAGFMKLISFVKCCPCKKKPSEGV